MPNLRDDDPTALARQIAMEVCNRRRAGEVLSDEQVLSEHPQLHTLLKEQLSRLRQLEAARQRAAAEDDAADLAQTFDSPPTQGPSAAPPPSENLSESGDELRITLAEQARESDFTATLLVNDLPAEDTTETSVAVPLYRPSVRAPMAILKLYHDGMPSYVPYPVMLDRFRIGRVEGDLVVGHDFWMSGRHAEIQRRRVGENYRWFLVDLKSTNGTFVHVDRVTLRHNDELFMGQERYRFSCQAGKAGLMHVTTGAGQQWWFSGRTALIGTAAPCGLKAFVDDPFLDPRHARIQQDSQGIWTLIDNNSRNGIWYRVQEVELPANCEFQLGEQRFGFWSPGEPFAQTGDVKLATREF